MLPEKSLPKESDSYASVRTTPKTFSEMPAAQFVHQTDLLKLEGFPLIVWGDFAERRLLGKLENISTRFGSHFRINQGLRTGDNEKFLADQRTSVLHRPAVGGKHVGRYFCTPALYVLYDPKRLDAPRDEANFTSAEKIIVQEIRNITLPRRIVATYDDHQLYCLQSTNTINWQQGSTRPFDLRYALGVLNSQLLNWFFRKKFTSNNHIASNQLQRLPLAEPSQADKSRHDRIVGLVDRMLELNKQKHSGKLAPSQVERVDREISATDAEIDNLVYDLYGITDDERRIIEGS